MENLIKIQTLGTGTILSGKEKSCSSILLSFGNENILLDAGAGTFLRLKTAEVSPDQITKIFLTHFHPDHVGDLITLLFYRANSENRQENEKLSIYAAAGLHSFFTASVNAYGSWIRKFRDELHLQELDNNEMKFPEFDLIFKKMNHSEESLGYRFEINGKIVAISGDTGYCENVIDLCKGADLAILECSHPEVAREDTHLSPEWAGKIAAEAGIKKLVVTHLYPETLAGEPLKNIERYYKGPAEIARDLMKIFL